MSSSSHHKAFVAELEALPEESIDIEDEDDPECEALLADRGAQDDAGPEIYERDLVGALMSWKEQRELHGKVKLGRGFAGPKLEADRLRVRCRNSRKVGRALPERL